MGHDPTAGGSMRDWYNNPPLEHILAEQADRLPEGPLGILRPPSVEVVDGIPSEALDMLRTYLAGELGTMDFANRIEVIRLGLNDIVLKP